MEAHVFIGCILCYLACGACTAITLEYRSYCGYRTAELVGCVLFFPLVLICLIVAFIGDALQGLIK